nr:RteC domain-containing protein [Pedobacter panaciterrae]
MIKERSDQLHQELKEGLAAIAGREVLPHIHLREQLVLIRACISELTGFVSAHPFSDEAEEIQFQKLILPRFKAQLIFHVELYNLQLGVPLGDVAVLAGYYHRYFDSCLGWVQQFQFYYTYRKLGAEELDGLYFTASGNQRSALLPVLAELDDHSTAVGHLYAKFLAYELLYEFMAGELEKLLSETDRTAGCKSNDVSRKPGFKWTGKVVDLIELAHGLHLEGQINNGKAGIVDFFKSFGEFFGVDLGIPKKGMDNLMDRKTMSRTRFTDKMRQSLHGKMDELERYDPDRVLRKMRL